LKKKNKEQEKMNQERRTRMAPSKPLWKKGSTGSWYHIRLCDQGREKKA